MQRAAEHAALVMIDAFAAALGGTELTASSGRRDRLTWSTWVAPATRYLARPRVRSRTTARAVRSGGLEVAVILRTRT